MRTGSKLSLAACAALLLSAASAPAATVTVRCAGRGARNRDSSGTVLCASSSKGRTIAGVLRNDAGKPVAGRVTVTVSPWEPATSGIGFTVRAGEPYVVTAKADGSFSIKSNPPTKESIRFEVVADAALGVSGGAFAQADVSRQLKVTLAKLGGGRVRLTVKGTTVRMKAYILDASGYRVPGVGPKKVDGRGQATFDLGDRHGSFTYYVDAGDIGDLFWYQGRVPFKL